MKIIKTLFGIWFLVIFLLVQVTYSQIYWIEMTGRVTLDETATGVANMRIDVYMPYDPYCEMYTEEYGWDGAMTTTGVNGTYSVVVPYPCYLLVFPSDPNGQPGTFHFQPSYRLIQPVGPHYNIDFARVTD